MVRIPLPVFVPGTRSLNTQELILRDPRIKAPKPRFPLCGPPLHVFHLLTSPSLATAWRGRYSAGERISLPFRFGPLSRENLATASPPFDYIGPGDEQRRNMPPRNDLDPSL